MAAIPAAILQQQAQAQAPGQMMAPQAKPTVAPDRKQGKQGKKGKAAPVNAAASLYPNLPAQGS
jgi:hypothetical protein